MFLSNSAMQGAAQEIRQIAAAMTRAAQELEHPATWSGRDADAFQRDWNDLVYQRLMTAADKLDGIDFQDLTEGFNG